MCGNILLKLRPIAKGVPQPQMTRLKETHGRSQSHRGIESNETLMAKSGSIGAAQMTGL